jgi:hypothetical protein
MNSPTAWNLGALRAYVKAKHDDEGELQELIRSIDRSVRIFRYHMTSARDAMKGVVRTESTEISLDAVRAFFGDQRDEFEWAKIVNEAHLIGCLHTARGMWDIYSQLLNRLVVPTPLPTERCDIVRVAAALPASLVRDQTEALLQSHWYGYVSAFVNTTKHRQLVQHLASVSFEEKRAGIRVGAFSYNGKSFPAYWDDQVLEGAIEVKNGVVHCGRTLNTYLGA